jgi:hypothetical protein
VPAQRHVQPVLQPGDADRATLRYTFRVNDIPPPDPTAKEDPETQQLELARVAEPLLSNGESWVVSRADDGTMNAVPISHAGALGPLSTLQQTHPQLYGALLTANARLDDTFGCGMMTVALLSVVLPCLAIHGNVLHEVFPDPDHQRILEGLRSWWTYGIAAFVGFAFWIKVNEWLEVMAYGAERRALDEYMSAADVDRMTILALMEGDDSVSIVGKHLKLERSDEHRL